jgi:lysophospholipase L1-like esterase
MRLSLVSTRLLTRVLLPAAAVGVAAVPATALAPRQPDTERAAPAPPHYLSLGDSLAAGLQPDARGVDRPTSAGYPDVLGSRLSAVYPGLRTLRLSCGGATTGTLLQGGAVCQAHDEPGQVVQAERFLGAHHETVLVTVNVGDNDVEPCIRMSPPAIDADCVRRGRAVVQRNLPAIARRLRAAAPPRAAVVGVLDYDQFLALWLDGAAGRRVARRSVEVISSLNALMAGIYRRAGVDVADAGARFRTTDLTTMRRLPGVGAVPVAVARICRWTWACSPPPIGNDDHARAHGYREIAQAVLDALAAPEA